MAMPNEKQNFYEVLHVGRTAPPEIIRSTYRTLMQKLKHHPDLGGDTETAALINEAYAVLSDVERRAEYDAQLELMSRIAEGVPGPSEFSETDILNDEFQNTECAPPTRILDPFHECVFCETPHKYRDRADSDSYCSHCNSPLAMAEKLRFESGGQRAVARIDKRQRIAFFTHWPQKKSFSGQTEDVSLNGLRFTTSRDLQMGQRIKIVSNVLEAIATVTHCKFHRQGFKMQCTAGVSFITLRFVQTSGGFVSTRV